MGTTTTDIAIGIGQLTDIAMGIGQSSSRSVGSDETATKLIQSVRSQIVKVCGVPSGLSCLAAKMPSLGPLSIQLRQTEL